MQCAGIDVCQSESRCSQLLCLFKCDIFDSGDCVWHPEPSTRTSTPENSTFNAQNFIPRRTTLIEIDTRFPSFHMPVLCTVFPISIS